MPIQGGADRPATSLTQNNKAPAIAVALVARPQLLLLEPFAGIAPTRRGLIAFIESIAATGVTILLIEHQMHA